MSQGTSASPDASSAVGEAEGAPACPGSCHLPGSHGPRGLAGLGYLEWHSRIDRKVSPQSWHAQVALSTAPGLWVLSRAREGGQPASVCTSLLFPVLREEVVPVSGPSQVAGNSRAPRELRLRTSSVKDVGVCITFMYLYILIYIYITHPLLYNNYVIYVAIL